jgi:serine/threonine protein kinase
VRWIGEGAVASVYEAFDSSRQRDVAIKVLRGEKARDAACVGQLLAEARALARVQHPNAVALLDLRHRSDACYLVLELMTGGSLQDALDHEGPLTWPVATRALLDACRALAATHAAGLVHRDVKPSNLMIGADGTVKLTDFGLATVPGAAAAARNATTVTPNIVMGTPQFMSPEQCRGEPVDARSDLYSLGATYYALLTGRPPYSGKLPVHVMFAQCASPPPDPRDINPRIPGRCAAIIGLATAKQASERYANAGQMVAALERCLGG